MPDGHHIGTIIDAAATLSNPDLGNGAAREIEALTQKILSMPGGAEYVVHVLAERETPLGSLLAEDINAALDKRVAGHPVLEDYLAQLREMAAQSPAAQANPDALLPRQSLEALALAHPHPDVSVSAPEDPVRMVDNLRTNGIL